MFGPAATAMYSRPSMANAIGEAFIRTFVGNRHRRLAVALIDGGKAAIRLAVENQPAGRGEHAAPRLRARGAGLRHFPHDLAGLDVHRAQEALPALIRIPARLVTDALFKSEKVIQPGQR